MRADETFGPLSPELALVDPALAARARAALAELEEELVVPRLELPTLHVPTLVLPTTERPVPGAPRIGPRRAILVTVVALLAGTLGIWRGSAESDAEPSAFTPPAESVLFSAPDASSDLTPGVLAGLEQTVRRQPRSAPAREALATAYLRLRRWRDAEAELRALVALVPRDDFAHFALGQALAEQDKRAAAVRELAVAESLASDG